MSGTLSAWLRSLDVTRLAALLRARPDTLGPPPPATPEDLAHRLSSPRSTSAALQQLSAPALALSELLQALGGQVAPEELRRRIAVEDPADAGAVELALAELTTRALVVDRGGRWRLVGAMREAWPDPLGTGEPIAATLRRLPPEWGESIRLTLGVRRAPSAAKTAAAVAEHLTADRVRELLEEAAPESRELLEAAVAEGGVAAPGGTIATVAPHRWRRPSAHSWLVDRGLLLPADAASLSAPREVVLAVRGDAWSLRLPLHPPEPVTVPADAEAAERESAAAAAAVLAAATELLEHLAARPAAALKTGGLGVREVRRLAKALQREEPVVLFAAHLADAAGLLAVHGEQVLPTPAYDEWRAAEPARRLASLLTAWWAHPAPLTGRTDDGGKPAMPLAPGWGDPTAVTLRHDLLAALAGLPDGRGVVDVHGLLNRVVWARPLSYPPPVDGTLGRLAIAAWQEMEHLGLCAHGRATTLGRALPPGDEEALLTRTRALLPPAAEQVRLQADLTAVVVGSPSAALAALLDEAADREARGSATVWRFRAASVRRVLDAGGSAEDLLDRLAAVAKDGVPQPLAYLIRDVARRHGHLAVSGLSCAVVATDPALLAEVAATRSLRPLAARLLAPTVLASAKPVAETVRLLREAGYHPVQHDRSGQVVLDKPSAHRAGGRAGGRGGARTRTARVVAAPARAVAPTPGRMSAEEVAAAILAAPVAPAAPAASTGPAAPIAATTTQERIRALAPRLAPDEVALLAHAVDTGDPVAIDYLDRNGTPTHRVVSSCELDPPFLEAWCHLRSDERVFTVSHIRAVAPA